MIINNVTINEGCAGIPLIRIIDTSIYDDIRKQTSKKHVDNVVIDFISTPFSVIDLSYNGKRSLLVENAGGNSIKSEALSIHYFETIYNATDVFLELEVPYWIQYKMVDFCCSINSERYGISVTRAMKYPCPDLFTKEDAYNLLYKKLYGLIVARNSVVKHAEFYKSILHVWCQTEQIAQHIKNVYESFDLDDFGLDIKGTVVLVATVYKDEIIYSLDKKS